MLPRERVEAVLNGQVPDRVPVLTSALENVRQALGYSTADVQANPDKAVEVMVAAQQRYGYDGLAAFPPRTALEQFGCRVRIPEVGPPFVEEPGVRDDDDLNRLKVPDPYEGECLPYVLRVLSLLRERAGGRLFITGGTFAPFTTAGLVRGIQSFLLGLHERPACAHRLLEIVTEFSIEFGRACLTTGVTSLRLNDPLVSSSVISPGHFEEFALPYLIRLTGALAEAGARHFIIHICGKTERLWEKLAAVPNVRVLSLDSVVDLAEAKRRVGDKVVIMGNVQPVETMYLGQAEDVRREAVGCIRKAAQGGGFILAPGCKLPPDTPPANVQALVEAARQYGCYPLGLPGELGNGADNE